MKQVNYYVIGGQYNAYNYGGTKTLHAAKLLATKHGELWDNWQGYHKPKIYAAEHCVWTKNFYGIQMLPTPDARPVLIWDETAETWKTP